ncbi:hypothetical protein ABC345_20940 [Shouchella sp. 1P09AA]|uniref:hypothetical protein n=1 Tax=unclassified Shouchella TaxID=2893065 RepID=UPI0039A09FC0
MEAHVRKERSDKKRDCRPTIPSTLYETFDRVSYITMKPIKTVGETIVQHSLESQLVMEQFAGQFVRDYWQNGTLYVGNQTLEGSKIIRVPERKHKMTMRLSKPVFNELENFAHALGKTTTSSAGLLLKVAVTDTPVLQQYVQKTVMTELDAGRKQQLKEVLKYIHTHNEETVDVTLFHLLDMIVTKFRHGKHSLKDAIDAFMKNH